MTSFTGHFFGQRCVYYKNGAFVYEKRRMEKEQALVSDSSS